MTHLLNSITGGITEGSLGRNTTVDASDSSGAYKGNATDGRERHCSDILLVRQIMVELQD